MKTALIIHGIGGHAGIHWQQWLHDELLKMDYKVVMPDLPNPDHPDRQTWLAGIKKALDHVDPTQLIIIGHSLGVTTALDFIEKAPRQVQGLISVSGFAADYGAELNSYFLAEKKIDFDKVKKNLQWSAVIYGVNDPYVAQDALARLATSLETNAFVIPGGGHLNTESGFKQFPKLLQVFEDYAKEFVEISNVVIRKDGKYLLVQEGEGPAKGTWNIPGGHVDEGETIEQAAQREAKEETGYEVRIVRKILSLKRPNAARTLNAFEASIVGGELNVHESEILDAKWLTYAEVIALDQRLRDKEYIVSAINVMEKS